MHYNTRSNAAERPPRPSAPVNLPDSPSPPASPIMNAMSPIRRPFDDIDLPQFGTGLFSPHLVTPTPCRADAPAFCSSSTASSSCSAASTCSATLFIPRSESHPYLRSDAKRAMRKLKLLTNTRKGSDTSSSSYFPVRSRRRESAFRSVSSKQSDSDLSEHISDMCLSCSDFGSLDLPNENPKKSDCEQLDDELTASPQMATRSRR